MKYFIIFILFTTMAFSQGFPDRIGVTKTQLSDSLDANPRSSGLTPLDTAKNIRNQSSGQRGLQIVDGQFQAQ